MNKLNQSDIDFLNKFIWVEKYLQNYFLGINEFSYERERFSSSII